MNFKNRKNYYHTKTVKKMAHKSVFTPWGKSTGYRDIPWNIYQGTTIK